MLPWILMYHAVAPSRHDPYRVTVHPRRLDAQLTALRRAGLVGVGVGELLAARARGRGRGLVGLTFDDGYRDFATTAVPLLRRHGCSATVYVISGCLGGHNHWDPDGERRALMTADEVRAVAAEGIEIGAHGSTHVRLDGDLTGADLAREVGESRTILEDVVGRPVTGFCYPYGAHDDRAVAAVRAAGYTHACATGTPPDAGRLALPRTYVGNADGAVRLVAKWSRHAASGRRRGARSADPTPAVPGPV